MKNKKGFTLVEILVTIVIIALIGGIGIIAVRGFIGTGEERYYNAIESDVLLAGNDYFTDHRDELPTGNDFNEVSLTDLVTNKYMDPVKDSNGNACTTGKVYVYRENNKYIYEVCLDCNGYKSEGKYCNGAVANKIDITAKTKNTNAVYNALVSYNAAAYTNNENVIVTFSMANAKTAKYEVSNTSTNVKKNCSVGTGSSCSVEIDTSGTYRVTAYDKSNNVIATNQYFNVKIAKTGPKFTVTGPTKIQISQSECSNYVTKKTASYTIVKDNINEEYKTIQYRVNNGAYKTINTLTFNETLESGHYVIEVKITNFADEATIVTKDLDISYLINLEYSDDPSYKATHEVVKGQTYDFLSALPTHRVAYGHNLEIRWHPDNTEYSDAIRILGTHTVTNGCTYKIKGLMSIPVDVPSDWTTYCNDLTYNGGEQTLTKAAPANVTFLNNKGTDAKEYTVKAHINSPLYIWRGDWTFTDKEFKCRIKPKAVTVTANNQSKTYDGTALTADATCSISGQVSGHTVTCSNNTGSITNVGSTPKGVGNVVIKNGSVDVTANYKITKANGTLTVNKRAVTIKADDQSKTYDCTALSASTACTVTSGSLVSGQTLACTSTGSQTNVGSATKTLSTTVIKSGSTDVSGNYAITKTNGTLTVNKRATTCTAASDSKTYDGKALTKSSGGSCTNLVCSHTTTFTNSGSITNVGSTNNTVSTVVIKNGSTDVSGNYSITKATGTLTVNKRAITIKADNQSKTYDCTALSASTACTVTSGSLVSGQTLACTSTGSQTNVGSATKKLSTTVIKSGSTDVSSNYTITKTNGTLTVNKRATTCTAASDSKTYDGKALTKASGGSCTNLVCSHTATFTNSGSITTVGSTNNSVSTVVIKNGSTDVSGNYSITKATGTLTVNKRAITIKADNQSKTYDCTALSASTACSVSSGSLVSGHTVTCTASGSQTAAGSSTKTLSTAVIKSGSTDVSANYTITKSNGTLTVNKRATTCTAASDSKTYDGKALTKTSGGSCTNLVCSHTTTFSNSGTITNAGSANNSVSSVTIKSGSTDVSGNYSITKANGTLTVNKRAITIKADNQSKTYDCTALSASTACSVSSGSLVSGHTVTCTASGSQTTVGSATKTLSTAVIKSGSTDVSANYTITKSNGTLTVNKRATTCTAASDSKTYDGKALTKTSGGSCTNLVCSHTTTFSNSGTITNAGSADNTVSSVTIKSGSTDVSGNYSITKAKGKLTVNKRAVTIKADNQSKTYDCKALSASTACSVSSGSLVSGHTVTCTASGSQTAAGSATKTLSTAVIKSGSTDVSANYTITKSNGTLTVNKRATTCTAASDSKTYDGKALTKTSGGSCTNLVCSHTTTFSNSGTITNVGSVNNSVSSVTIKSGSTDVSGNYSITKANGKLTISCKSIGSCTAGASRTYNGSSQSSGVTCPTGASASGTTSAIYDGNYKVTCTGSGNYCGSCESSWNITISCGAGTYLPASSRSCTACPDGYYCSGISGKYVSSSNQGLTSCGSSYPHSDGARTGPTNCYYDSSYQGCVGHTRLNQCTNTNVTVGAVWVEADWIPDYYKRNQKVHDTKCLENVAVCKNGSNCTGSCMCYKYSHTNCYNWDYTWALANDGGPSVNSHCDCRRVVALSAVACKVHYGSSNCV